jgi:hypothetical protein
MSLRGHHDWADRRQSYFSANYPTAADTEQAMSPPQPQTVPINNHDINRSESSLDFRLSKLIIQFILFFLFII